MRTLTALLPLLLLVACEEVGDTTEPATVAEICGEVFDTCDGWGWDDQATCEEGFVGSTEWSTECSEESTYLECMGDCLDLGDCDSFTDCETDCWSSAC